MVTLKIIYIRVTHTDTPTPFASIWVVDRHGWRKLLALTMNPRSVLAHSLAQAEEKDAGRREKIVAFSANRSGRIFFIYDIFLRSLSGTMTTVAMTVLAAQHRENSECQSVRKVPESRKTNGQFPNVLIHAAVGHRTRGGSQHYCSS